MAAQDTFASYISAITPREREALKDLIITCQADLFAARSEEARLRVVNDFLRDSRSALKVQKK
ncbi:MAG TPA: hypothetical protein VEO56_08780 [Bacteroidota bacterium]|nr:hypothetical protein [Bacteroidota bacterium]